MMNKREFTTSSICSLKIKNPRKYMIYKDLKLFDEPNLTPLASLRINF